PKVLSRKIIVMLQDVMGPDAAPPARPMDARDAAQRDCGSAEMITNAWAIGPSSVMLRSIDASWPAGVMALRRASAPPVSFMVGFPEGRLTTPMSRQNTPARKPVPSALAQASLAAKRLA